MGKSFLEQLDETFGTDVLADVIPVSSPQDLTPTDHPSSSNSSKRGGGKRKKRFLDKLNQETEAPAGKRRKGKKSFLDTIEEALEDHAFDDLFPKRRQLSPSREPDDQAFQKHRFSVLITSEVLERARQIAEAKGIHVNDVINIALERYIKEV